MILEKENYIPNKYINMMHGIEIIKVEHKECIYWRKNEKRNIKNVICNESKISLWLKCYLSYQKIMYI